jgi:hypothetical protein
MKRTIRKGRHVSNRDIQNALESLFVAETLCGSSELWIVSPWLTDVPIVDNRGARFSHLSELGERRIALSEILIYLAMRFGTKTTIVVSDDAWAQSAREGFPSAFLRAGYPEFLTLHVRSRDILHEKTITTRDWMVSGSMNFTIQGISVRDEHVEIETDPVLIAEVLIDLRDRYSTGGAI